ncbi:hypothetical protein D3C72_841750 [compost metagenome]
MRIPLITCRADAQGATGAEVNEVVELLVEFHPRRNDDHPACIVIGMHPDLGDDIAGACAGFVLVFNLHQRFLALIGMDLADDDFPGTRHLVHCQSGIQQIVGFRVIPVFQRAVAVGFTQFGTWINCVFGTGAGHGRPEKQCAGVGMEVLILETVHQFGGFDGVRRAANGDAEVPGCKIDHVGSST